MTCFGGVHEAQGNRAGASGDDRVASHLCRYFITASVRLWTLSFSKMLLMWPWTVQLLMPSVSAISLTRFPLLRNARISCSRGVSLANCQKGGPEGSKADNCWKCFRT